MPAAAFLLLAALSASAPDLSAQAPLRLKGTILDVPDAGDQTGPAGRFWFEDWPWPADVDREHLWKVDPRSYATRARSAGDLIAGEVEALKPGGKHPRRSLVWDRSLRPRSWDARSQVLLATEDGLLLVSQRGGEAVQLIDGKRSETLKAAGVESWRPRAANGVGLILGDGLRREQPVMVVYQRKRSRKSEVRVLPLRLMARAVNENGWVIGQEAVELGSSRGGAPRVYGPLLRDGSLAPLARLEELEPLAWRGPADAQLVAFAGAQIAGYAPGADGRQRAWVWSLDPRASAVGEYAEELPSPHGDAVVLDANANGLVLGRSGGRPVLWQCRGDRWVLHDLRKALPKNAPYTLVDVAALNDRGHIVGTAALTHEASGKTYQRGIRLTPRRG